MGLSPRLTGRASARAHHSPAASAFLRRFEPFFAGNEVTGGPLLLATILALVMTNSPWAHGYERFWDTPVTIGFGARNISHALAEWIDHALLPIFFVIVGADVKREMVAGPLSQWRTAAFPLAGALGGMVVPVALFWAVAGGTPGAAGWGSVITTDTAFGLALIALFGTSLPAGLRALMLAFAAVDDVGGLLIIAFAYSGAIAPVGILVAGVALAGIIGLRRIGWVSTVPYVLFGVIIWGGVLASGIHATIAGVLIGLTVPVKPRLGQQDFAERVQHRVDQFRHAYDAAEQAQDDAQEEKLRHRTEERLGYLHEMASATREASGRLIELLTPWVNYVVLPLFAMSNVRIHFSPELLAMIGSPLVLGVVAGLALGKPLGFLGFTWAASAMGLAQRPVGVTWPMVIGIGALAGIGFTISLFIAGLAFGDGEMREAASLGVLIASILAAGIGYAVLRHCAEPRHAAEAPA
ncbi:Na+/H+ antiporter NhaA [Sphingomonas sp. CFBP8993]|uniref:Na+/H+ antiporter NhaA n=1 Tax=Sphingomonas sp. CFBP8993 TaxID=3096526 RepID=UPI002A6B5D63|nr:Na+/H+ antiporter NhaA [Sphingomonas sp. CFBP8993]MDY0957274.1 Na+/H+ antiporter NhaA [Sphingomonas sp. CFBP8993]